MKFSKQSIYRVVVIAVFSFFSLNSFAQKSHFLESKVYSGIVAPHHIQMESLAKGPTSGTEINYLFNFDKNSFYDKLYNSPYTGFGVSYEYLGNPEQLGLSFAAYTFMELKLFKIKNLNFNTRVTGGLTYITKKFDFIANPENIAIGTNVCFYFNLNFGVHYPIKNTPISLRANAGMIHFSNGSVKKPNRGLNQIQYTLSAAYNLVDNRTYNEDYILDKTVEKPHEFTFMATITSSDEYKIGDIGRGGGYLCSTGALGYSYAYSPLGKVGLSADIFYNENLYWYWDTNWDTLVMVLTQPKEIIRSGISVGHELVYKKLSLVAYAGLYFYNKVKPHDFLYTRFGLRYYVFKNVFVNATVKAFGFKAHYIETGIGFSFRK